MVARLPVILGHEPAGEVVEVGARVTNFKVGDRVALDPFGHCGRCGPCRAGRFHLCAAPTTLSGAFAEYTIAPVGNAHLVPSAMSVEQAALLEPFGTGLHAVEQSCLKAGDSAVDRGSRTDRPQHRARGARPRRYIYSDDRPRGGRRSSRARADDGIQNCLRRRSRLDRAGARAAPCRRCRRRLRRGRRDRFAARVAAPRRRAYRSRMARARSQVRRVALACSSTASRSSTRASALRKPGAAQSRWSQAARWTYVRWSHIAILSRTASKPSIFCASAAE